MRPADVARLVSLAAIWGGSFIFIRVLAPALGPILTAATRVLIAGAVLVLYCRATGFPADLARYWRQYLVIGVVNSTLPFVLYAFAALHIPASYSVILNSTTPLFTALLAVPLLGERLTLAKVAGLVAGAAGVALVSKAGPVVPDLWFGAAVAACLAATLCYAVSSIYMKKHAVGAKPLAIAGWSQVFAGLVLLPVVPFAPAPGAITPLVVANVLGLALDLQLDRLRAVLPADRRCRPDARLDGGVPDARVRHGLGRALSRRDDHVADDRGLRADHRRHRRGAAAGTPLMGASIASPAVTAYPVAACRGRVRAGPVLRSGRGRGRTHESP